MGLGRLGCHDGLDGRVLGPSHLGRPEVDPIGDRPRKPTERIRSPLLKTFSLSGTCGARSTMPSTGAAMTPKGRIRRPESKRSRWLAHPVVSPAAGGVVTSAPGPAPLRSVTLWLVDRSQAVPDRPLGPVGPDLMALSLRPAQMPGVWCQSESPDMEERSGAHASMEHITIRCSRNSVRGHH
jgi:hypothetical protein